MNKYSLLLILAIALGGCSEKTQKVPEPSHATCEPQAMKQILFDLSDAQKQSFIAACKSWQKARDMESWTYKPSTPDNY